MASVNNLLTRIQGIENDGTWTTANLPSGGGGAGANTDIFLQGSQSLGKRTTNVADTGGFVCIDNADNDCSAADVHVGVWCWVTQFAILDDMRIVFGTGTGSPTNYDAHTFPYATEYPKQGGWVRAWIDVSRTPENPGGSGLNEAQLRSFGLQVSFASAPGGTSPNVIFDAADYTNGGAALSLTGASGLWTDLTTADHTSANQYGVFRLVAGIYNCFARVLLGTASSLVFNDSGFVIIFPQQALVADNFMGISIDLQNAATNIDWANGVLRSAGTKRGDLVVTGTSGDFDANGMSLGNLRIVTLTAACSLINSTLSGCGQITGAGAIFTGNVVSGYEGSANTSALIWDVNVDPDGYLDNCTFTKGTAATHAIEFGTNSPTTLNLIGMTFNGYNASNNQNDSALHIKRTNGQVDIYCATSPSYRSDGATVVMHGTSVNVTVAAKDVGGNNVNSAMVLLKASDGTGPFPFEDVVTIANSGTTATVHHVAHGMATNDKTLIDGASHWQNNGVFQITVTGDDYYTYTMPEAPGSDPTGTILSTFVALFGSTANGVLTTSRVYPSNQPVTGWVRKSSSQPYYKPAPLTGAVDSGAGFSSTVVMISDE